MPRRPRACPGGYVCHVLSRAAGRATLFREAADDGAFGRVLVESAAGSRGR